MSIATARSTETPTLAVSTVIFTLRPNESGALQLATPLVRRIRAPFEGQWALPGGPLQVNEDLATSASHTLRDTTGLEPRYLEQLYAFGSVWVYGPTVLLYVIACLLMLGLGVGQWWLFRRLRWV